MQRFVTAVFKHETNTFSPIATPIEAFGRYSGGNGPISGKAAVSLYRGTNTPVSAYLDLAEETGVELDFAIACEAVPSAPADDAILEQAADAICNAVKAGCEALLLDMHGGMVTKGHDDPEGELLRRIRQVAPDLPIAVSLDFHTNMSRMTIDNATVITGYRTYPHIDTYETGQRAGGTLMSALKGEVDPVILWHSLPLHTHLNCQTPSRQPMKDIMDMAIAAEREGRVLNASVFGGWPLADIPHVGVHGVIVADRKKTEDAKALLEDVMAMTWDRRDDFFFAVEPIETSVARAASITDGPVVLADHGDVAGSGGSTDVTTVLAEIIKQGLGDMCAGPFWDPETVAQMDAAGVGADVKIQLGGRTDFPAIGLKGQPLELSGSVSRITDGTFTVTAPKNTGIVENIGKTAVLDTGGIEIVICSKRHEPYDLGVFTHAGIDPAKKRYILIKSRQHYRAGFEPVMKDVVMISGPGVCTSDYSLFPWKNVRRPVYPFDKDVDPGLARI